jgi:hypothetical protein
MWLRTALLLVLGLILYRLLGRFLQALGRPAGPPAGDSSARPGHESAPDRSPGSGGAPWPPEEVIDVSYRELPRDSTPVR